MVRVIVAIALAVLLTACGITGDKPPAILVERALSMQLSQTQEELSQQLRLAYQPDVAVQKLKISAQLPLKIQSLQSFQVKGTCDYTVKLPTQNRTERNIPFEVFLQRQQEGKTWRLATLKPGENGDRDWVTQRIPTETF
jgi:hypothetical protein